MMFFISWEYMSLYQRDHNRYLPWKTGLNLSVYVILRIVKLATQVLWSELHLSYVDFIYAYENEMKHIDDWFR